MKFVSLANSSQLAIVDDEDYERVLTVRKWYRHSRGYVYSQYPKQIWLHHFIMGTAPGGGMVWDHADRNPLNNQRCNLRRCTYSQNLRNRKVLSNSRIGYKGVALESQGRFRARIVVNGKYESIGRFDTAKEAALAYDARARELFGEFALTNFGR